jgi:hypothetical protein
VLGLEGDDAARVSGDAIGADATVEPNVFLGDRELNDDNLAAEGEDLAVHDFKRRSPAGRERRGLAFVVSAKLAGPLLDRAEDELH